MIKVYIIYIIIFHTYKNSFTNFNFEYITLYKMI